MRAKYVLSEVLTGLWRNVTMTIAMIITMAVSLTMLGASLILYHEVGQMKTFFYDKIEVSIFLRPDVTGDQRDGLRTKLEDDELVQQLIYESKEQAFSRFRQQFRDAPDLVNATKPDALPESFRVKLKDPTKYKAIYEGYKEMPGISEIVDQQQLLGRVFGLVGAIQSLALFIAIVQGLAALLLVANTIQVAAYSKRREVAVMKLVGASNWFIQLPFVLEAIFAGLIGSVLASLGLVAGKIWIIDGALKPLANLLSPVSWNTVIIMFPLLAGIAAVISALTGWITLRFYVRV
ncbi:MAG TPA: permease-like cell division protein FtsX [Micromonosporaceae bacterium]|nr:permease-like cell division protein FtsX [Micromonosporaceae bacterium]